MVRGVLPLLICATMGCGDTQEATAPQDAAVDATPAIDAGSVTTDAGRTPPPIPRYQVAVIQKLSLAREDAPGVSEGIDLDGLTSRAGEMAGCGQRDFTASDGRTGIDNQFGLLVPLIEAAGGEAFGAYLQGSVNDGKFLVMMELDGVDDLGDDDSLDLVLYRGLGTPSVGNDGLLEAWQTFDVDPEGLYSEIDGVQIVDGVMEAGPIALLLPFYIFDFVFELDLVNARIRMEVGPDGVHRGVRAGAVRIDNILAIAEDIEGGDQVKTLLMTLSESYADLLPDENGVCQALSATIAFETVGAFFYEDTQRPE